MARAQRSHPFFLTFLDPQVELEYRAHLALDSLLILRFVGSLTSLAFTICAFVQANIYGVFSGLCFLPTVVCGAGLAASTFNQAFFAKWMNMLELTCLLAAIFATVPWAWSVQDHLDETFWVVVILGALGFGWACISVLKPILPITFTVSISLFVLLFLPVITTGRMLDSFLTAILTIAFVAMSTLFFIGNRESEKVYRALWLRSREIQVEARAEVKHLTSELTETKRASDLIIAYISHEVRNPLNGILNMAHFVMEALKRAVSSPNMLEEHVRLLNGAKNDCAQISSCCEVMMAVVNDSLDICKLEEGNMRFEESEVTCEDLLTTMHGVMGEQFREKGLEFTSDVIVRVDRNLFPRLSQSSSASSWCISSNATLKEDFMFKCDVKRVKQVVLNLLGNALKYTKVGSVSLKFDLQDVGNLDDQGCGTINLNCEVCDSGSGISEADQITLFQPFRQLKSTMRMKGLGLGLYLCRLLVRAMGGDISCQSQLGQGSVFRFTIPVNCGPQKIIFEPVVAPAILLLDDDELTYRQKVLVVDDMALNREIVKRFLEREQHIVSTAIHGQDAIDVVQQSAEPFDVIFMDVNMPVMNGLEATIQLKQQLGVKTKIIGLSGDRSETTIRDCLAAGMVCVIPKPVTKEELLLCLT